MEVGVELTDTHSFTYRRQEFPSHSKLNEYHGSFPKPNLTKNIYLKIIMNISKTCSSRWLKPQKWSFINLHIYIFKRLGGHFKLELTCSVIFICHNFTLIYQTLRSEFKHWIRLATCIQTRHGFPRRGERAWARLLLKPIRVNYVALGSLWIID